MNTRIDVFEVVKAMIDTVEKQLAGDGKHHNVTVTVHGGNYYIYLDGEAQDYDTITMGWWVPMSAEQRAELERQIQKERGQSNE